MDLQEHFRLQLKRLDRMVREWGLHPMVLVAILAVLAFIAWKACTYIENAPYLITGVAVLLPYYLLQGSRNRFLSRTYKPADYRKISIIEHLILSFIPVLILCLAGEWILAVLAIASVLILLQFSFRMKSSRPIPTPFGRWPFEFTRGFRKSWWLYLIAAFILIMAIRVNNPNLGVFAVLIPFLLSLSFYLEPEDPYFLWIYNLNSSEFLFHKMKIALRYTLTSALPLVLTHAFYFPDSRLLLLGLTVAGVLWVMTSLLAKYAHFPSELNLLQGFAVVFAIIVPPIALLMIPILFQKAKKNLSPYLA